MFYHHIIRNKKDKRLLKQSLSITGFTLIELLIVIGIIAILAGAVIIAINPGQQFQQARDATREAHINALHNSLISYQTSNMGTWGDISLMEEFTEICNTNLESPDCSENNLIDLSELVPDYINQIPVDPQGGDDDSGTGYFISEINISLVAANYENRFVGRGVTESEYLEGGEFTCAGNQGEHDISDYTVYCDSEGDMWTPTLDENADWASDINFSDSPNKIQWGCFDKEIAEDSDSPPQIFDDGYANTVAIVDFHNNAANFGGIPYDEGGYNDCGDPNLNQSDGIVAAKECYELEYAGYDDWYLPDIEQAIRLGVDNCDGNTIEELDDCEPEYDIYSEASSYWTSVEHSSQQANQINYGNGFYNNIGKDMSFVRVRCVRSE